jgi:mRNA interferase MazF
MAPRPGDVFMIDLGMPGKVCPGVVLSREDDAPPRDLILVGPLTTEFRGSRYEISVGKPKFLREPSWVNLQGVQSMRPAVLLRHLGGIDPATMAHVKTGLRFVFDL